MPKRFKGNFLQRSVRTGGAGLYFLGGLLIAVVLLVTVLMLTVNMRDDGSADAPLVSEVRRDVFQYFVTEDGEIESTNNVEIRCEIRGRATGGAPGPSTTILEVIPEGSLVEEGDWLITFDSAVLEQEKLAEKILLNTIEASMIDDSEDGSES